MKATIIIFLILISAIIYIEEDRLRFVNFKLQLTEVNEAKYYAILEKSMHDWLLEDLTDYKKEIQETR